MNWSTRNAIESVRDSGTDLKGRSSLFLMLTGRCNMSCSYCYQTRSGARSMSREVLRQALDFGLRSGGARAEFLFTGGEALLEWELVQSAVHHCREARKPGQALLFGLLTNGLLMSPEVCAFLAHHEFSMQLSCDGIAATQDRRGKGSLDSVLDVLEHLRQEHPTLFLHDLVVAMTVPRESIPHMAESIEFLIEKGVRHIALAPGLTRSNEWNRQDEETLREQMHRIVQISRRHLEERREIPVLLLRDPPPDAAEAKRGSSPIQPVCAAAYQPTIAVDTDGSLLGCLLFSRTVQDFGNGPLSEILDRISLGQVGDSEPPGREVEYLKQIQGEPLFTQMHEWKSSHGPCVDCELMGRCAICPIDHAKNDQLFAEKRVLDYQCAFNRFALETQTSFWREAERPSVMENGLLLRDQLREAERIAKSLRFEQPVQLPESTETTEQILRGLKDALEEVVRRSEESR